MTQNAPRRVDESGRVVRRPTLILNRKRLALLFGFVLICPLMAVALIYWILPQAHDLPLPVEVVLLVDSAEPPVVRVKNLGAAPLHSLRIELNGAFAYFPQAPLPAQEYVDLPLDWFMKKTGHPFRSTQTDIRTIHISARLPNNRRAIFSQSFSEQP
ncbi:MAG: hypothetical protein U0872_11640 [Planctomycetaceae bacterium]